jgi:hypothetical protein
LLFDQLVGCNVVHISRFLYLWAKHVLKPTLDSDPSAQKAKGRSVKKRLSGGGIAPTPAIDLAWHAHMVHPIAYRQGEEKPTPNKN